MPEGPVITLEAAEAMASGVRKLLGSTVGIGITGVAGPDAAEGRPPGTVCVAVDLDGDVSSMTCSRVGATRCASSAASRRWVCCGRSSPRVSRVPGSHHAASIVVKRASS
ncbi:MAG: CinA family protein [Microthrixaceae bacterium]